MVNKTHETKPRGETRTGIEGKDISPNEAGAGPRDQNRRHRSSAVDDRPLPDAERLMSEDALPAADEGGDDA